MRTKKFKLIILLLGLFAIHFSKVYGMEKDQEQSNIDVDKANIIQINEESKYLSNKEKSGKYKGIIYKKIESGFVCIYRCSSSSPQKTLCRSKDFGTCVYKAQQLVRDNVNIPADTAQLIKKDFDAAEVKKINEENKFLSNQQIARKYKSIYAHYTKGHSFRFECQYYDKSQNKWIYVCSSIDIGRCVSVARQKAKNDPTIPADIAQLKEECIDTSNKNKLNTDHQVAEESIDIDQANEISNPELENIHTIITKYTRESYPESVDKELFAESDLYEEESKKRKREEYNEFNPGEYITIAETTIISPKFSILANVDTKILSVGTSLHIVRIIINEVEGVVRGKLRDGGWVSIKALDSEDTCVMEKHLLDNLFQVLQYSNWDDDLFPMLEYMNKN